MELMCESGRNNASLWRVVLLGELRGLQNLPLLQRHLLLQPRRLVLHTVLPLRTWARREMDSQVHRLGVKAAVSLVPVYAQPVTRFLCTIVPIEGHLSKMWHTRNIKFYLVKFTITTKMLRCLVCGCGMCSCGHFSYTDLVVRLCTVYYFYYNC